VLRSNSQVLYSYLPGAVFRHEDRVYGKVVAVDGTRLTELNDAVIYEEIATYLERWPEDQRHDLPLPKDIRIKDYRLLRPEQVRWELFPLVFECARRACGRVRSFRTFDELAKAPTCQACKGPLQQLRFYARGGRRGCRAGCSRGTTAGRGTACRRTGRRRWCCRVADPVGALRCRPAAPATVSFRSRELGSAITGRRARPSRRPHAPG